ncbi:arylamine N-acetyltransferase family protein [Nocardiopsis coralliicola]
MTLDTDQVDRYLERIGAERPGALDAEALRHLHERHLLSVPFETVDYHLGADIHMDERVVDKIVGSGRGGGCSEIAVGFHLLLEALGFRVALHQARVRIAGGFTPPFNHAITSVQTADARWLADVGFGKCNRFPLRLGTEEPQQDPHGEFTIRSVPGEPGTHDVYRDRDLLYRFSDEPVAAEDGSQVLWWYRTHPMSPFLQNLSCSRPTAGGWAFMKTTRRGTTLVVTDGRERRVEKLTEESEILRAYSEHFGIELDRLPEPSRYLDASMKMSYEDGT